MPSVDSPSRGTWTLALLLAVLFAGGPALFAGGLALFAGGLALFAGGPAATADEAGAGGSEDGPRKEARALREATPEEAKALLAALKKVYKKKDGTKVLPALEPMAELQHESWDKVLARLLRHDSSLVAMRVADMWAQRVSEDNLKAVWKASWMHKANKHRFRVKARVLRALAIAGHELDDRQYKEVERDWRWMIGNPNERYAEALIDICWYFEKTKDKRHCRWMAEELDDPTAGVDPNNPNTQPAAWQERRWKMWNPMKPAAVRALAAITGQEFDKTKEARAWFEANEATFGFEW
jgi:hypothetical protein